MIWTENFKYVNIMHDKGVNILDVGVFLLFSKSWRKVLRHAYKEWRNKE